MRAMSTVNRVRPARGHRGHGVGPAARLRRCRRRRARPVHHRGDPAHGQLDGVREKLLVSDCVVPGDRVGRAALCCLYTAWRTTRSPATGVGALRRHGVRRGRSATSSGSSRASQPVKPFPTVSDLFFVIALVLAAAGLPAVPRREADRRPRASGPGRPLDGVLGAVPRGSLLVLGEMVRPPGSGDRRPRARRLPWATCCWRASPCYSVLDPGAGVSGGRTWCSWRAGSWSTRSRTRPTRCCRPAATSTRGRRSTWGGSGATS